MKVLRRYAGSMSLMTLLALLLFPNQIVVAQYVCQINGAPILQTGAIAAGDPTQTGRVFRDGIPSSCTGGAPTQAPVAGSYRYDSYTYTNPTGAEACVTVEYNMTACGGNTTQVNAYSTFNPASAGTNVIGKPGFSTTGTGSLQFSVAAGGSFTVVVHEVVAGSGCANYSFTVKYRTGCSQAGYDHDGDGNADFAFFRPSTGTFNIFQFPSTSTNLIFGQAGDIPTAGDYTGDGRTNVSVWRPSTNTWFYSPSYTSPQTNVAYVPWGTTADIPVPGDYDKDGKTDIAIFRSGNGVWYVLRSSDTTVQYSQWGANGDLPVVGDYDGDLQTDLAVVRPSGGQHRWFILGSNFGNGFVYGCGTTNPFCGTGVVWGVTTDKIVSGDFDGDARSDVAIYRPSDGTWHYLRSSLTTVGNTPATNAAAGFRWGILEDIPQPADYDGDKRTDFAVYRPTAGTWFASRSDNGTYNSYYLVNFGNATDIPISSAYKTP